MPDVIYVILMEMVSVGVEELHLVGKHPFLDETYVYCVNHSDYVPRGFEYGSKKENQEFILITPYSKYFLTKEEGVKELKTMFK